MTAPRSILAIATALLIAAPIALAPASAAPKQLYHWVSADGKDHYSDVLPPEALNQARQEISTQSGMTLKQVDRALTVDERAAAQAKTDADARAAEALEKAKQSDQVLLSSYPTETELKHAYDERLEQQVEAIKTTRMNLESQQQSLGALLIAASNIELSGKPVNADMARTIQTTHAQVIEQLQTQMQMEAQAATMRQESAAQIARYRSLRAAAEATTTTPATPNAPPPGPPKG